MGKNLVLIGFMGTGKSTVGMRLAERLNRRFVDMDREIENLTGCSISELFRKHGEIRFRSEEQLMVQKLSRQEDLVIATGGGVVLYQENIEALRESGILIRLKASPDIILNRVSRKKGTRPLIKKGATVEDIERMLLEREEYYSCADITIETTGKEMSQVVGEITEFLAGLGIKKLPRQ